VANEVVSILIKVAVVAGIVLGGFWLFKNSTRATVQDDKSMDPVTFPEGGYGVNTHIDRISQLKSGDVVAYHPPKNSAETRVARVIGVEGNRVEVTPDAVLVNGTPFPSKFLTAKWTIPETRVPRGCVYVLADNPFSGVDSKQFGPLPFSFVIGTVKPVK